MKPCALLKASDTLEALDEEMALGVCPFLFFAFSPRTTSQPGSADATELGPREMGASAGRADGSAAVGGRGLASSAAVIGASPSRPPEDEAESAHLSEDAELFELVSDNL